MVEGLGLSIHSGGLSDVLGKPYASDVAFFGPRMFILVIPGTPTGGPFGKNNFLYHDEFVTTEIGQVFTQFDGPDHIGVRTIAGDPTSDIHYIGIWNLENLDFSKRLADGVYEFAFIWAPLKIVDATGSPGNPIALYCRH